MRQRQRLLVFVIMLWMAALGPAPPLIAMAQQPQPRTGILMMAAGDPSGTVVYKRTLAEVHRSAVDVARAQGRLGSDSGEAGPIRVDLGRVLPDGGSLQLAVALSTAPDGRVQVDVTPSMPVDLPATRSATKEFVAALTASLAGTPPKMRLCVFTDEAQPSGRRTRRQAVGYLNAHLGGLPVEPVSADMRAKARIWIEVLRVSDAEGLAVRLTVPGTGYATEWTRSSPRDTGSASDVADVFKGWLALNRDRLLTERSAQPTRPVPCAVPQRPVAATSAAAPTLRLFVGPTTTADGFVDFDPAFRDSYADLCAAFRESEAARSVLTLASDPSEADLVLGLAYRNEPLLAPSRRELRARLRAPGPGLEVALSSRAEGDLGTLPGGSSWRTQATRLLLIAARWATEHSDVLLKAQVSREPGADER